MPSIEAGQPLGKKALLPAADVHGAAAQPVLDHRVGRSLGEQQHQLGPLTVRAAQPARSRPTDQLDAFGLAQDHGVGGFKHPLMIADTLIK